MWTSSEITRKVRNEEITIRWDLMPQPVVESTVFTVRGSGDFERLRDMKRAIAGYYFCMEVWDCRTKLLLIENRECGARVVGEMEDAPEGILVGAVEEAGSAINLRGRYTLSRELRRWLDKRIWNQKREDGIQELSRVRPSE